MTIRYRIYKTRMFKPKKIIRGRRPKKIRRKMKGMLTLFLIISFIIFCYQYIEKELLPTVMAISEYKVRTVSVNMIGIAVKETLDEMNINTENLVTYYYDADGNLQSFGVNSVLINQINTGISERVSEQLKQYSQEMLSIPLGRLLGKSIFANAGPNIKVKVQPYGSIITNYRSSFESTGINQINHRIWINIEMTMQVVIPLDRSVIKISQDIMMIDRVMNGQVPSQYIYVPEDEFMNVVQ